MLDEILTFAVSHIQLITAGLMFAAVFLELVHIGQTRRINKRLHRAGKWLQRYLSVVLSEDTYEEPEPAQAADDPEDEAELSAANMLQSRQEENMRTVLAQKKQRRNEELLDTVLQEIFD
ncbi:MAG: hypothetical protein HFH33_02970 [Eubacterium sp.]|jgi:hypothetical protein|nr:hypothetical protein [Eubacterium sp.]